MDNTPLSLSFSEYNLSEENEHISNFRIIYPNYKTKIDSVDGCSVNISDIDYYDIIFRTDKIIENNNILYITGTIGYDFDSTSIELIYDIIENKIYIASCYRLLIFNQEYELFQNSYQMSYDKVWYYEKVNDGYILQEKDITTQYYEIDEKSIPYYRFPRTKDGISISRVIYNIFKIFRDEKSIKPTIIIPNNFNIYSKIVK
jgi:hypothetical protein